MSVVNENQLCYFSTFISDQCPLRFLTFSKRIFFTSFYVERVDNPDDIFVLYVHVRSSGVRHEIIFVFYHNPVVPVYGHNRIVSSERRNFSAAFNDFPSAVD